MQKKHFSKCNGAYLYMSLNDTEKEETTQLSASRENGNKIACLELLI